MKFVTLKSKPEFSVSRFGEVKFNSTETILTPYIDKDGYARIQNMSPEGRHYVAVHRAVAEVYVTNPDPVKFKIVNHLDGDVTNNEPDNLEWTSHKMNRQHAVVSGNVDGIGENHSQSILTVALVEDICKLLSAGLRIPDIAKTLEVDRYLIYPIKKGKSWTTVSRNFPDLNIPRAETFSSGTVGWVSDQISRGYSEAKILSIARTLDAIKLQKILNLIDECNDYP